jgi:hypothetical protein
MVEQTRIHKTVHHFILEAISGELSDSDVEVVKVAWVPIEQVKERLKYRDERRLMVKAMDLLAG